MARLAVCSKPEPSEEDVEVLFVATVRAESFYEFPVTNTKNSFLIIIITIFLLTIFILSILVADQRHHL